MLNYELTKQHFHVRIYRSYLQYIATKYPHVDIHQLCERSGLSYEYLQSADGWASIHFNTRFMAEIRKLISEPDFEFEVGQISFSKEIMGSVYYVMKTLMPLDDIYANMWRLTSHFNKVVKFEPQRKSKGKIDIRIRIVEEGLNKTEIQQLVASMPDIVNNSLGFYSGFAKAKNVTNVKSAVTKTSDLEYCITLNYPIADSQLVISLLAPCMAAVVSYLALGIFPVDHSTRAAASAFAAAAILAYFYRRKVSDLSTALITSDEALGDVDAQYRMLVDAKISLQRRLSEAEAINQLTKALTDTTSEDEILQRATDCLTSVLSFDRVVLMLANSNQQVLEVRGYSVLDKSIENVVRDFKLPLDIESSDPTKVSNIYKFGKSVLISDVVSHISTLNSESQSLLGSSGSKSFVGVPISSPSKSHGVLLADTFYSERELTHEDMQILTLAGQQIAMALEKQRAQAEALEAFVELGIMAKSYSRFVPFQVIELLGFKKVTDIQVQAGKEISMAVVFCDIRGFTTMSETMSPTDAVAFLNSYFSHLAPTIHKNKGIIDKFMGDGIMSFFMDPKDAIKAAAEFQQALAVFNQTHRSGGIRQFIKTGMGIHFGKVILGAVGYEDRLSISVVSDAVNLASRLDGLTKKFGVDIVCSEETYNHCDDENFRLIAHLNVEGRKGLTRIYEYFGHLSEHEREQRRQTKPYLSSIVENPDEHRSEIVPLELSQDGVFKYYAELGKVYFSDLRNVA